MTAPYRLTGALDGSRPILLASPHSGTHMPADFLAATRLDVRSLRRIEDAHVGALLAPAAATGLPLLEAVHSRAVIDLNRAEDELDPSMFVGQVTPVARITDRVRRGYGLFPRVVAPNQPIHHARLPATTGTERIARLHRPWHAAIEAALARTLARHGHAVLLDVHSMPSLETPNAPALVLGDLHGRSAAPALVDWLHNAFTTHGLKVARNSPYAGGYTTERHGRPLAGVHCVQLEFDRALYMDPALLRPHAGFAPLAAQIAAVLSDLESALPQLGLNQPLPFAAE
ncbi:N-formylglutamate amidohydrolase [Sandaracinobacter neustonicus]|uniref:N-formylglutamate amidohydrolase n=1 Tax=Sandaracinobacter neustonicus TaxID=1715348 RepID=UPI0015E3C860|nr:N-formylglutamate amidohydrolase [Sandaracinobacter neustonicus]